MESIKAKCPSCGNVALVPADQIGQNTTCLRCNKVFTVAPTQQASAPSGATPQSIAVQCTSCGKRANLPLTAAGKTVKCGCGNSFPVPNPNSQQIHPPIQIAAQPSPRVDEMVIAPVAPSPAMEPPPTQQRPHSFCPSCSKPWIGPGPICSECGWNKNTRSHVGQHQSKAWAPSGMPTGGEDAPNAFGRAIGPMLGALISVILCVLPFIPYYSGSTSSVSVFEIYRMAKTLEGEELQQFITTQCGTSIVVLEIAGFLCGLVVILFLGNIRLGSPSTALFCGGIAALGTFFYLNKNMHCSDGHIGFFLHPIASVLLIVAAVLTWRTSKSR